MKVYLLIQETYGYWDNDYSVSITAFNSKQSAINYLAEVKEFLIRDALETINCETTEELTEDNGVYVYEDYTDYFKVDIEEWGYECLYIEEKIIMEYSL